MSENGNNMNNLRYVFILIGVLALLASYFLVFTKYNTKISDISDEIKTLRTERDRLKELDANKDNIKSQTASLESDIDKELSKYDGGLSYKAEIMDTYDMTQDLKVDVNSLTLNAKEVPYTFGQLASVNPNGGSSDVGKYTSESMSYDISTNGTYDQMKQIIKYIIDTKGKRKALKTISISGGGQEELNMTVSLTEYAIAGEGREIQKVEIPDYEQSTNNLFFNQVIVRVAE